MAQILTMLYAGQYIQSEVTEYTNTNELLTALNYNTSSMTFKDDLSTLNRFIVDGINGNGSITLGYVKIHVVPSTGGIAPFTISSVLDSSENETFDFTSIRYIKEYSTDVIVIGNAGIVYESLSNDDKFALYYVPEEGITTFMCLDSNIPVGHELLTADIGNGLDAYFTEVFEGSSDPMDFFLPIIIDLTVDEAYTQDKLKAEWVDINTEITPAGTSSYTIGGVYVPSSTNIDGMYQTNAVSVDSSSGELKFSYTTGWSGMRNTAASNLSGEGLSANSGIINVSNATSTTVGGMKARLSGTTLYVTTDGTNP